MCHRETGNLQLALNDFQNAADLDRRDPSIAANLGDILINNVGDPTQAMIYLDRAIELNAEDAEAYRNRGWAHTLLREFEEGVADLEKSIELDPSEYETYQRLANAQYRKEKWERLLDDQQWAVLEPVDERQTSDSSELEDSNRELLKAIRQLNKIQRRVLWLRYYVELDFQTIADILQCPRNTAFSHCRRGLENLRRILQSDGSDPANRLP